MTFKNLAGKSVNINVFKYQVNWDAKERSIIQFKVKQFLKPYWKGQFVCSELRVVSTRLTLDLYNVTRKIAIEVQGNQHQQFNKFFHSNSRQKYLSQIIRDDKKQKFCDLNGIKLVEIFEEEVNDISKEWFIEKYDIYL